MDDYELNNQQVYTHVNLRTTLEDLGDCDIFPGVITCARYFELTGDREIVETGFDIQRIREGQRGLTMELRYN
jgi:hypothetical protein